MARFQGPQDATFDFQGSLVVSDLTRVRKISSAGEVTTLAGNGLYGYRNGRGVEAQFGSATGICVDTNGNIYVADSANHCIRKIAPDTAGIGIADDWQREHFDLVGINPAADPDGDGASNYSEFWAGTNPKNSASRLALHCTRSNSAIVELNWQTVPGKGYTVQSSDNLIDWLDVGTEIVGDGGVCIVVDPELPLGIGRYYRVALTRR